MRVADALVFSSDESRGAAAQPPGRAAKRQQHSIAAGFEPTTVELDLPEADQWQRLVALYESLAEQIAACVQEGPVQVVAGDCLAAIGTLAGVQRGGFDPSIVWFDAHGDLHTVESSVSGYLGGLPLRMALGADYDLLGEPPGLRALTPDRATLVGARDLDSAEEDFLASSLLPQAAVDDVSPDVVPDGPILLDVDLDVIDAEELPGLRFPAADGATRSRVVAALHTVCWAAGASWASRSWFEPVGDDDVHRRTDLLGSLLRTSAGGVDRRSSSAIAEHLLDLCADVPTVCDGWWHRLTRDPAGSSDYAARRFRDIRNLEVWRTRSALLAAGFTLQHAVSERPEAPAPQHDQVTGSAARRLIRV